MKKEESGITLVALAVTVILLLILSGISVGIGTDTIRSASYTAFSTELKILQNKTNELAEQYNYDSTKIGETLRQEDINVLNKQEVDTVIKKKADNDVNKIEEIKKGFRLCSKDYIKNKLDLDGMTRDYLINLKYRIVVSCKPQIYKQTNYYMMEQMQSGYYNVDYNNQNATNGNFSVRTKQLDREYWQMEIYDIKHDKYVANWEVKYKQKNEETWNFTKDLSFKLKSGVYQIQIFHGDDINLGEVTIITRDISLMFQENNTIDGGVASHHNPTIPGGFKPKDTETSTWGDGSESPTEENVKKGLVIEDANHNEFVWIPVENVNEMYGTLSEVEKAGKLYNFTSTASTANNWTETNGMMNVTSATEYREPDTISTYDENYLTSITDILTDQTNKYTNITTFKTTMQEDYDTMIESIIKYKGFYVGRYETSLDSNKLAQSKKGELSANASQTDNNAWYGLYARQKQYKTNFVQGSMIWGSQYDAMMRWMQKNSIDVTSTTPIAGATRNTDRTTGTKEEDRLNNIYDILGNSLEWTIESITTNNARISRGGYSSYSYSPSNRETIVPTSIDNKNGSRITLYIK